MPTAIEQPEGVAAACGTISSSDDAAFVRILIDPPNCTIATMVMIPAIGALLILVGLILFIVDLNVIGHGVLTAGSIVLLLVGGFALLWAGLPYAGVLFGVLVVVTVLMGGVLLGGLGSLRALGRRPALTGKEGMIGELGTVRSPVGVHSEGWVFVHGERWRAVLAFAPGEADSRDGEPIVDVGRRVRVVGFGEGSVMQVVPIELPGSDQDLDRPE